MDLNTTKQLPEWLTKEKIKELKQDLLICDNPYTDEDVVNLSYDGSYDAKRYNANLAKRILSKYDLL